MRNFELEDWAIVDPRTLDFAAARRVAVHSEELLDKPKLTQSLDEAVAEASWVVGTSSRHVPGLPVRDPRAFAQEATMRGAQGQAVALVFGDERSGMTNVEIKRCHALARVPSGDAQPSLNLAQAVTVFAYELRMAALAGGTETPRPVASDSQLVQLEAMIGQALTRGGFLDAKAPRHALRDLLRALQRAQLSPREWRLWMAAAGKLARRPPAE